MVPQAKNNKLTAVDVPDIEIMRRKVYDEAIAPARKVYHEASAQAWKVYDQAREEHRNG